jgi:signal transduction histidine kinase
LRSGGPLIALEALNNVRKHAGASEVHVLAESREGGVFVRVRDDGGGFTQTGEDDWTPGHLGLLTMRERAELSGGGCGSR